MLVVGLPLRVALPCRTLDLRSLAVELVSPEASLLLTLASLSPRAEQEFMTLTRPPIRS
ncbi:hypothetical protein Plhal304r1_c028g0093221 [Plasmopara halstedii]